MNTVAKETYLTLISNLKFIYDETDKILICYEIPMNSEKLCRQPSMTETIIFAWNFLIVLTTADYVRGPQEFDNLMTQRFYIWSFIFDWQNLNFFGAELHFASKNKKRQNMQKKLGNMRKKGEMRQEKILYKNIGKNGVSGNRTDVFHTASYA